MLIECVGAFDDLTDDELEQRAERLDAMSYTAWCNGWFDVAADLSELSDAFTRELDKRDLLFYFNELALMAEYGAFYDREF